MADNPFEALSLTELKEMQVGETEASTTCTGPTPQSFRFGTWRASAFTGMSIACSRIQITT